MVRTAKLFLLVLSLVTILFASDAKTLIKEADSLLLSKNKSSILKSHNNYKSAYLKAILNGDDNLAKKALAGIEKSSNMLKDDLPKNYNNLPKILTYRANKNQIFLTLSKKIDVSTIETFSLQDSGIKKVIFDIPAIFDKDLSHIRSNFFKDVRIAQYSQDTVRVVMEKGREFYAQVDVLGNKLVLTAYSGKNKKSVAKSALIQKSDKKTPILKNRPTEKVIFIDAGHGGKDGGAIGYKGLLEKDVVMNITILLSAELSKRGYKIRTSRNSDKYIELENRTKMANRHNSDLFISIHANATANRLDTKGIETYFLSPARNKRAKRVASTENKSDMKSMGEISKNTFLSFLNREKVIASNKFAIDLQKNILSCLKKNHYNTVDHGVREGPFWVLVGAQMPAVLIEVGYITNPTEAKRLKTKKYQKLLAIGIADGVDSYFYHN